MSENILNQPAYRRHLYSVGLALIAVSVLYLLAANWWMLPKEIQLAVPQLFLLLSASASIFFVQSQAAVQTLHTVCGLMLGLSLAVIGQVYQAGTDSYLLFLLWSLLLLPWLYRKNTGIIILLSITGFLSLMLLNTQLGFSEWQLNISVYVWLLLLWLYAKRFYIHLNKYFTLWICFWSIVSMVQYVAENEYSFVFFIAAFLPLMAVTAYEYWQKNALTVSMLSAAAGINLLIWIAYGVLDHLNLASFGLLLLVVMSLGIFGVLTKIILSLFPASNFGYIPLFIGAWLSGLLLAAFVIGIFRSAEGVFVSGLLAFPFALYLLKRNDYGYFMKQLYYCILIFAQLGLYGGLLGMFENPVAAMLVMLPLIISCYLYKLSPWLLFLQFLSAYGMLLLSLFYAVHEWGLSRDGFSWLWSIGHYFLYAVILFVLQWIDFKYRTALLLSSLFMILIGQGSLMLLLDAFSTHSASAAVIPVWGTGLLFIFWWASFYKVYAHILPLTQLLLWFAFSAVLCVFGYFEIFLGLLVLAWALFYKHAFIYVLSIVALCLMLWLLYYSLDMTFLHKSITIFGSGLAVLGLAGWLKKLSSQEAKVCKS